VYGRAGGIRTAPPSQELHFMAAGRASGARRLSLSVLHLLACVKVRVHAVLWGMGTQTHNMHALAHTPASAAHRETDAAHCFAFLAPSFVPQREPQCPERCGHCSLDAATCICTGDAYRWIITHTNTHTHTHMCTHGHTHTHTHTFTHHLPVSV
jgi:hypothetical protein